MMSAPVNGGSVSKRFRINKLVRDAEAIWHQALVASARRALNDLRLDNAEEFDDSVRLFYETSEAAPRAKSEDCSVPARVANPFGHLFEDCDVPVRLANPFGRK